MQAQPRIDPYGDRPPPAATPDPIALDGLVALPALDWNPAAVRRVLQSFAFGGHASDSQIHAWAAMLPERAIVEMLTLDAVNQRLSPAVPNDRTGTLCHSLTALQEFWSSADPLNPVRAFDRPFYALLSDNNMQLSPLGLYLVWGRAMHTRGCNGFLHKLAFYLTNYHASIHIQNTGTGLIRDYYDDTLDALISGEDFIGLMFNAARNGAVAFAYGHATNFVHPFTGEFSGNDDFAREYFQLLFSIQGTTEDPDYHESVTIENNALLLTGMFPDQQPGRFDSVSPLDWFVSGIDFSDHIDAGGRQIYNRSAHNDFRLGSLSCLEILHQSICGATAEEKLRALGPVAASHPESLANTPLKLVRFFGDTVITPDEAAGLQSAWAAAQFDLLRFIRAYAISTAFHDAGTFRYWSAFERNLLVHNATLLSNEESFARPFSTGPIIRMYQQGALPFAPIRDVFGGQTGNDAANDRYVFKNAWAANVENPQVLAGVEEYYRLQDEGEVQHWQKDWSQVIPRNAQGNFVVHEVAEWLWNRLVADNGANFDRLARAQVYSLLATGFDFAAVVDRDQPDIVYQSADLESGEAAAVYRALEQSLMDLSRPLDQHNIGMAMNFISVLPYAFAAGGDS